MRNLDGNDQHRGGLGATGIGESQFVAVLAVPLIYPVVVFYYFF